ncbi:MAG: HAD family hydrolase [Gemmataceae bacterium]
MTPHTSSLSATVAVCPPRAALFDFDGTLSLLREGWSGLMAAQGVRYLEEQGLLEDAAADAELIETAVLEMAGRPSIHQMERIAEIIASRGGLPDTPLAYHAEFLRGIAELVQNHRQHPPESFRVPGAFEFLTHLQSRGVELWLASGTHRPFVVAELAWLGMDGFFGPRVFAPDPDFNHPPFHKRTVVEQMAKLYGGGEHLAGFGDGPSETAEIARVGGRAVGLATQPAGQSGRHAVKERILRAAGAEQVLVDFTAPSALLVWLGFPE